MGRLSALATLLCACIAVPNAAARAQEAGPAWVDPPRDLQPVLGAAPAAPAKPASPAKVRPAAEKSVAAPSRKVARRAPVRRAESLAQAAPRTDQRRARMVQQGMRNGLELMMLETVELPNGDRIEVLTEPDPAMVRRLTRGR
jgi:hypothetical protein